MHKEKTYLRAILCYMWRLSVALLGIMLVMMLGSIWYATQSVVTTTLNGEVISTNADGIDINLLADDAEAATGTTEVVSLKAPDISPTSIKLGYKTEFFIKAVLPTDVVLTDARVQVLKSTGKWATLGKLRDDGQLGDIAGDGKMYLDKTFKIKNPTLVFRIRAMEGKGKYRVSPRVLLGEGGVATIPSDWFVNNVEGVIGISSTSLDHYSHGGILPFDEGEISVTRKDKISTMTLSDVVQKDIALYSATVVSNTSKTIDGREAIEVALEINTAPTVVQEIHSVYILGGENSVVVISLSFYKDSSRKPDLLKSFEVFVRSYIF